MPHAASSARPRPASFAPLQPLLLRLEEAAALCGETPSTFERLVAAGHYPKAVDRPGRLRLWSREALEARIAQISGRDGTPLPPQGLSLDDEFGFGS